MSIRDDFFANQAISALWDVAVSIKRGNPLPLDSNSVFASYSDLETYAAGVLAYPGQIIAVVNEDSTQIYYLDQELNIQPVGSVPSVDNKSIELNNDVLSVYNFEKYFYKYVNETTDEETGATVAAHYEKVAVSDENPWIEGLEPRAVLEDGEYVIGWYEPNPTTVDGIKDSLTTLQEQVDKIDDSINGENGINNKIEEIENEIGAPADEDAGTSATGIYSELDKKANSADVYTKLETQSLIDNAAHLKRKIFDTLVLAQEFVDANPTTADQYIYMIPSGLQLDSNRYYEYMVVDGVLEQVGNWEVELDDYFTEEELKTYLESYYTSEQVQAILADYATKTDLEGYYTSAQVDELLEKYYTQEELDELLNKYVLAEEGKSLVSDTEIAKLATVKENAEPNYIKSVTSDFQVSEAGQLSLVSIKASQVSDLQALLDKKVDKVTSTVDGEEVEWILLSPENQAKLNALVIGDEGVEISGKVNAENVEGLGSWITTNRDSVAGLYPSADATKLLTIQEGAEKNFIRSVDTAQLEVDADGKLSIKNISASLFTDLSSDFTYVEGTGLTLTDDYVKTSVYIAEVGDLAKLLRDIGTEKEDSTLVDEINYINERLQWQTLSE